MTLASHFEGGPCYFSKIQKITASLMAKVRKLSGEAGIMDKICTSSKNVNYVQLMVLSLLNHWPSSNNIYFKDSYAKTAITKKRYYPLFYWNVHTTRWSRIEMISNRFSSRNVFIVAISMISYSKIDILILSTSYTTET